MDCTSSHSSGDASSSALSSELTEDHTVLNRIQRLPNNRNPSSLGLMKEIAVLEDEIMHLERYLLSLYRSAFQQHLPTIVGNQANYFHQMIELSPNVSTDLSLDQGKSEASRNSDSLQVQCSLTFDVASPKDLVTVATPNSVLEKVKEKKSAYSWHGSLAHHLGNHRIDNTLVSPDRLSEDIIRCIASIYCKLANTPKNHNGYPISSTSSHCSSNTISPRNSWSPQYTDEIAQRFNFESLRQASVPYFSMLEVLTICLDKESYNFAAKRLQKFRSLVKSLEIVDPKKMSREEKLAFWINIHNALVMHGYLAYGTQTYMRSTSVMKASYNVGGNCVNAYEIQSCILGIKDHSSAPWLQTLLSPGKKLMAGTTKHPYAIEYPEPLVHFALCSGMSTDPAIRVYSAKTIFNDLKVAKEEFIKSTTYVHNQAKLYLPKILRCYAKDMTLSMTALLDVVNECLTPTQQKAFRRLLKSSRPERYIYWIEQSSSFRYLIHQALALRQMESSFDGSLLL